LRSTTIAGTACGDKPGQIPVEPGINREFFRLLPKSTGLSLETAKQINPLPVNSRSRSNANFRTANRELNPPNRELYRRKKPVTAAHKNRTGKTPIGLEIR
jgi:hypothetical protein